MLISWQINLYMKIFNRVVIRMYRDREFFENLCKYCIKNYQVMNSSRMMASLIYQCCKKLGMDVTAVEGLMFIEVNGYKRPYAHCFNVYKSNIIDASIYQFALMNKAIENLFPLYILGSVPDHLEYSIMKEIKRGSQIKFKDHIIEGIIREVKGENNIVLNRFSINEDSKKKNLFYLNKN